MLTFITIQALGPEWHRERGHSRQRNYSDKKHRKKNDKILPQCENVKISTRTQIFCFQNVNVNTTNVPHNNDDNVGGERSNVTNETLLANDPGDTHTHSPFTGGGWVRFEGWVWGKDQGEWPTERQQRIDWCSRLQRTFENHRRRLFKPEVDSTTVFIFLSFLTEEWPQSVS